MLETVREYALDRLATAGEEEAARRAHAAWYLAFAEDAQSALWAVSDEALLARIETEHDNLRAALGWAVAAEPETALRLAGGLAQFWAKRSYWSEGRAWLERALAVAPVGDSEAHAAALGRLGAIATDQGDYELAVDCLNGSLAMAGRLGLDPVAARARRGLGIVASHQSEFALATEHFDAALATFRALADRAGIARCLNDLGVVASREGDFPRAIAYQEEALPINRALGDESQLCVVLGNLGGFYYDHGDFDRGEALTEEALVIAERLGDTFGVAVNGYNLGCYALIQGDAAAAAGRFRDVLGLTQVLGERHLVSRVIDRVGAALYLDHKPRPAARLFGAAAALRESLGDALFVEEDADLSARFAAVRAELGEAAYGAAWENGRSLPFEVAVAEATRLAATLAATSPSTSELGLTPRETEVLRLMAEGRSDKEIADALFVARSTASKHVAAVIAKLGADSRTAAVSAAHRQRLV
jgi:non-specific serine/threonine protein kinase